jgi:hypothetical protein
VTLASWTNVAEISAASQEPSAGVRKRAVMTEPATEWVEF